MRYLFGAVELRIQVTARYEINALKINADFQQALMIDALLNETSHDPQLALHVPLSLTIYARVHR